MKIHTPIQFLGVNIHPVTRHELFDYVTSWVNDGEKHEIGYVNIHCMNLARKHREFRDILNSIDIVYCDGFGVLLGANILGCRLPERMTGADWMYDLMSHCEKQAYSLYFLGGEDGVAETAAEKLRLNFPKVCIKGTHHGYFEKEDCNELIKEINTVNPDLLLIGFGSPLQERWMWNHRSHINAPVCWVVGAVFDFVANKINRGPKWMTDNGLEWACRLYFDPRRLWNRYLLGNPLFMYHVLKEKFSQQFIHRKKCSTDRH